MGRNGVSDRRCIRGRDAVRDPSPPSISHAVLCSRHEACNGCGRSILVGGRRRASLATECNVEGALKNERDDDDEQRLDQGLRKGPVMAT